jgi:5-methylthioadenosine/S-adenosylhomocysteine deaminase
MEKEIGSLEAGKKADIIIMDTDQAHLLPRYDVYSHLVYAYKGSDVLTTIIGGQVVFDKERTLTLDESQIRAKAREYKTRILASLGKNPG